MHNKFLLSAKEAASALGISTRHLFALTRPRGPIPAVRLGKRVLYRPQDLEAFLQRAVQNELERSSHREGGQAAPASGG
jgi:excisionase family DNA binding protein